MNKKNLVKIIKRELSILVDFVDGFEDSENIHPMEVDLALSKAKDIYDELFLLKEEKGPADSAPEKLENKPQAKVEKTDSKIQPEIVESKIKEEEMIAETKIEKEHVDRVAQKPPKVIDSAVHEMLESVEEIVSDASIAEKEIIAEPAILSLPSEPTPVIIEPIPQETPVETVEEIKQEPVKPAEKAKKQIIGEPVKEEKEKSEIVADKFSRDSLSVNDMLAGIKKNKDLASLLKDSPIADLKKAIKLNDRIWFINELFNKNSATFEKAVDLVNKSENLDRALEYLFTNFNWNQDRKSTISFLELVFRRFASK